MNLYFCNFRLFYNSGKIQGVIDYAKAIFHCHCWTSCRGGDEGRGKERKGKREEWKETESVRKQEKTDRERDRPRERGAEKCKKGENEKERDNGVAMIMS